jgi:hypothetical protein
LSQDSNEKHPETKKVLRKQDSVFSIPNCLQACENTCQKAKRNKTAHYGGEKGNEKNERKSVKALIHPSGFDTSRQRK